MKYLVWILVLFAAAVALTSLSHSAAYLLLVYPPYRIELSLMLFVLMLFGVFILAYGVVRLLAAAVQMPEYVRQFRLEKAQVKGRELLEEAMSAFFEGRYAAAERASARAMELGDNSALHPIIAARAAHELHEYEKRDVYLSASEPKSVGDSTMRLMTASKFMLDQHDPRAALDALQQLRSSGVRGHIGALSLELKAQQQAGNWGEVLNVLAQLEKRAAIDVTMAAQLRQQAWLEKIRQQESLQGVTQCLAKIPTDFKRRTKIVAVAAQALIKYGGCDSAQHLLADSLNAQWDSELVALYGDCQSGEVIEQIEQAEKWLKQHQQDAGLLLALGKLCLHQKLWGKAQNYLDASLSVSPSASAYTALGRLAECINKPEESLVYLQKASQLESK